MEGREQEVSREPQHSRMRRSRVSLFIVAMCLRLFLKEDVSSQGRVPLFFSPTVGRLLLPRGSFVLLVTCVQQFLLFILAHRRHHCSAADSGPVSTRFCKFSFSSIFYKYKSSTFFVVLLWPLNANRFVRFIAARCYVQHFPLTVPQRHTLLTPGVFAWLELNPCLSMSGVSGETHSLLSPG